MKSYNEVRNRCAWFTEKEGIYVLIAIHNLTNERGGGGGGGGGGRWRARAPSRGSAAATYGPRMKGY